MRDKAPALSDLVISKGIDLLGIAETWLTTKETSPDLAEMNPQGLSCFHEPRAQRRGGGLGLFMSSAHKYSAISLPTQTSLKAIYGKLECGQSCLIILNIYRPPGPTITFFSDLQDILSYISTLPHDLARMWDFNLRIDSSSSDAGQLFGILESFDLHQYVDFPTHVHDHYLDLMICSSGCNVLSVSTSDMISDHSFVVADLQIPSNQTQTIPQTIKYQKLQSINLAAVKADINNSELIRYSKTNATELAQQYDSVLHALINLYAPLVTKKTSLKPPNPWMTPAILASKRHRRYLERVRRRNPTTLNRSILTRQINLCNKQMSKAKSDQYSKITAEHCSDHRSSWKAFNEILHRCPKMHQNPDHSSTATLANTFSSFYINKISVIRSSFPSDSHSRVLNPPYTRKVLQNLTNITADEMRRLVLRDLWKSSDLDPIPTSLLKDCIDVLITPITFILN